MIGYGNETRMLREGHTEIHIGSQIGVEQCGECVGAGCADCAGRGDVDAHGYTVFHAGELVYGCRDKSFAEAAKVFAALADIDWDAEEVQRRSDAWWQEMDEIQAAERAAGWDSTP